MKDLKEIILACNDSMEVLSTVTIMLIGMIVWSITFFNMHWMAGILSLGYYPQLMSATVKLVKKIESLGDGEDN